MQPTAARTAAHHDARRRHRTLVQAEPHLALRAVARPRCSCRRAGIVAQCLEGTLVLRRRHVHRTVGTHQGHVQRRPQAVGPVRVEHHTHQPHQLPTGLHLVHGHERQPVAALQPVGVQHGTVAIFAQRKSRPAATGQSRAGSHHAHLHGGQRALRHEILARHQLHRADGRQRTGILSPAALGHDGVQLLAQQVQVQTLEALQRREARGHTLERVAHQSLHTAVGHHHRRHQPPLLQLARRLRVMGSHYLTRDIPAVSVEAQAHPRQPARTAVKPLTTLCHSIVLSFLFYHGKGTKLQRKVSVFLRKICPRPILVKNNEDRTRTERG